MLNLFVTTAMLAFVLATPALAQTSSGSSHDVDAALEAVIVTARRREESIRDVPGTIAAVTADQLESKGPIAGSGDLLNTVPGVRFNDVASENLAEVSIRGSGTQRATGADSGVGLFVNGAYVGSSTLGGRNFKTLDYFDLERVEALQGPQGALYGRNSEFGVVNIILAKPKFENSGYVRDMFTFDLNQNRLAGVANHVAQRSRSRCASARRRMVRRKGFYYNPNQDKYYDSTNGWTARGQIRYRSGPLDMTLLYDAQDLRLPTFVNSLRVPSRRESADSAWLSSRSRFVLPHTGKDSLQQKVQRVMLLAELRAERADDARIDHHGHGLDLEPAIRRGDRRGDGGRDAPAGRDRHLALWPDRDRRADRTIYQDLHLTGNSADGQHVWIVGGEALLQRDDYQRVLVTSPCAFTLTASFCNGTPSQPVCVRPLPTSTTCPTPFPLAYGNDSITDQSIESFAAYASLQYSHRRLHAGRRRALHAATPRRRRRGSPALYTTTYIRAPTTYKFSARPARLYVYRQLQRPQPDEHLALCQGRHRLPRRRRQQRHIQSPPRRTRSSSPTTTRDTTRLRSRLEDAASRANIFLRLSGYSSRTTDAITSLNDGCTATNVCGTTQQFFNVNGGTIHARGVEAALDSRFRIGEGVLSIGLNAATQRAHFAKVPTGVTGLPIRGIDRRTDPRLDDVRGDRLSAADHAEHQRLRQRQLFRPARRRAGCCNGGDAVYSALRLRSLRRAHRARHRQRASRLVRAQRHRSRGASAQVPAGG